MANWYLGEPVTSLFLIELHVSYLTSDSQFLLHSPDLSDNLESWKIVGHSIFCHLIITREKWQKSAFHESLQASSKLWTIIAIL